jgi:hypothetical protein
MNVNSEKYLFSTFRNNVYQLAIVTWRFRVLYECLWSTNLKTMSDTTKSPVFVVFLVYQCTQTRSSV